MRDEFYFSDIFVSMISKSLSGSIQSLFNLVMVKFPCPWNKWHNLRLILILDINVYLQITAVVEYIFSLIIKYNVFQWAKVKLCAIKFSWRTYIHTFICLCMCLCEWCFTLTHDRETIINLLKKVSWKAVNLSCVLNGFCAIF